MIMGLQKIVATNRLAALKENTNKVVGNRIAHLLGGLRSSRIVLPCCTFLNQWMRGSMHYISQQSLLSTSLMRFVIFLKNSHRIQTVLVLIFCAKKRHPLALYLISFSINSKVVPSLPLYHIRYNRLDDYGPSKNCCYKSISCIERKHK